MKLATPSLTNNATNPQREAPERDRNLRVQHADDQDCPRVPPNSGVSPSSYLEGPDVDGGGDQICDILGWINSVEEHAGDCDKLHTLVINVTAAYQALYQDPKTTENLGQIFKNNEPWVAIRHIFGLLEDRGVSPGQIFRDFQALKWTMLTSEGQMLFPSRLDIKQVDKKPIQLPPLPPDQKWDYSISAGVFLGKLGLYACHDESPTLIIYKAAAAASNMDKMMPSYQWTQLTINPVRTIPDTWNLTK